MYSAILLTAIFIMATSAHHGDTSMSETSISEITDQDETGLSAEIEYLKQEIAKKLEAAVATDETDYLVKSKAKTIDVGLRAKIKSPEGETKMEDEYATIQRYGKIRSYLKRRNKAAAKLNRWLQLVLKSPDRSFDNNEVSWTKTQDTLGGSYTKTRDIMGYNQPRRLVQPLNGVYQEPRTVQYKRAGRRSEVPLSTKYGQTLITTSNDVPCGDNWPANQLTASKIMAMANTMLPSEKRVFQDPTTLSYAFVHPDVGINFGIGGINFGVAENGATNFGVAENSGIINLGVVENGDTNLGVPGNFFTTWDCKGNRDVPCSDQTHYYFGIHLPDMMKLYPGNKVLWLAMSPPVSCVEELVKLNKPTRMYFGSLYLDGSREINIEKSSLNVRQIYNLLEDRAVACLALLSQSGFEINAWDWREFGSQTQITNAVPECSNTISTILQRGEFENQSKVIIEQIQRAKSLAVRHQHNRDGMFYECTKQCRWVKNEGYGEYTRQCN